MSIRSKAEDLLSHACVTDGHEGTEWVIADEHVEALRDALKEPTPTEVVESINQDTWDALYEEGKEQWRDSSAQAAATLSYQSNGFSEWIEFLGQNIWDDQDNGIPWDDATDAPASSLRDHLLSEMRRLIESLGPLAAYCAVAVKLESQRAGATVVK